MRCPGQNRNAVIRPDDNDNDTKDHKTNSNKKFLVAGDHGIYTYVQEVLRYLVGTDCTLVPASHCTTCAVGMSDTRDSGKKVSWKIC